MFNFRRSRPRIRIPIERYAPGSRAMTNTPRTCAIS